MSPAEASADGAACIGRMHWLTIWVFGGVLLGSPSIVGVRMLTGSTVLMGIGFVVFHAVWFAGIVVLRRPIVVYLRAHEHEVCPKCAYPLAPVREDEPQTCPECGAVTTRDAARRRWRRVDVLAPPRSGRIAR